MKIDEKLFGPANSVMVTRNQLGLLASEVYKRLNVQEEYEVPESKFDSGLLDSLIRQAAPSGFSHEPLAAALKSISPYMLQFNARDLSPDTITKEMSEIFKLEKSGDRKYLKVDTAMRDKYLDCGSKSGSGGEVSKCCG